MEKALIRQPRCPDNKRTRAGKRTCFAQRGVPSSQRLTSGSRRLATTDVGRVLPPTCRPHPLEGLPFAKAACVWLQPETPRFVFVDWRDYTPLLTPIREKPAPNLGSETAEKPHRGHFQVAFARCTVASSSWSNATSGIRPCIIHNTTQISMRPMECTCIVSMSLSSDTVITHRPCVRPCQALVCVIAQLSLTAGQRLANPHRASGEPITGAAFSWARRGCVEFSDAKQATSPRCGKRPLPCRSAKNPAKPPAAARRLGGACMHPPYVRPLEFLTESSSDRRKADMGIRDGRCTAPIRYEGGCWELLRRPCAIKLSLSAG